MPLNGSGSASAAAGGSYPASANTLIESGKFNTLIADFLTMISTMIAKDGQTTATARIPFAAGISVDDIDEKTSNTGVNIDGVTLKDGGATLTALMTIAAAIKSVTEIEDTNGNELLKFTTTASAVNELTLANAATTGPPVLFASGGDTNITFQLRPKGSGTIQIVDGTDTTKAANIITSGLTAGTVRNLHAPDQESGLGLVLATKQASTSGTSFDFTGIPSWAKRIVVMFAGVSTNGTSNVIVQLGDSGGIETAGYVGSAFLLTDATAVTVASFTTGFGVTGAVSAASVIHGALTLTLADSAGFTWVATVSTGFAAQVSGGGGSKSTSAALDRVRVTTVNGTDTFDAGFINVLYE